MAGPATLAAISIASTAIGAGMGVYSSIAGAKQQERQLNAQAEQSRYQAEIARRNQQLSEEEASAKRRQGYESMTAKRLETARLIGRQRAAQGASGAALDEGSALDVIAENAASGEMEAINLYNKGVDEAYQSQMQAWNYGQSAAGHDAAASSYDSAAGSAMTSGLLSAGQAALGGIASAASTWGAYKAGAFGKDDKLTYDPALQKFTTSKPRH